MALSEVFSFTEIDGTRAIDLPQTPSRKRIIVKHPRLTAWAQFGPITRISLRRGLGGMAPAIVAPCTISGPFFDGADPE